MKARTDCIKCRKQVYKEAEALRHNAEGLLAKGFEVPIDDLRYIKLAEYENAEESRSRLCVHYDPDEEYYE